MLKNQDSMQHNSKNEDTTTWSSLRAELIQAGEQPDLALIDRVKSLGLAVVPGLIELAMDKEIHDAGQDNLAVWAPLHAIQILGDMEAADATEPLLSMLAEDDDELAEFVENALGKIGRPALQPLRALLFDRSQKALTHDRAMGSMAQVARCHPELGAEVVEALTARLAAVETQAPEDETLNGGIICSLLDMKAVEALPAIRQAFDEDRVDTLIVDFDSVQREFGLPGAPPLPRFEWDPARGRAGLNLRLKCTACGAERPHFVAKIYGDLATMDRRKAGEEIRYSEYVIPQRITCPKCGAIDQYKLTSHAYITLSAELLAMAARREADGDDDDQAEGPLVYKRFTLVDGREIHPYEARDLYRRQVEAAPESPELRIRYGNVLVFLGYRDEAIEQYQAALERDSANIEAAYNLGKAWREAGNLEEARRQFEHILANASRSSLPREQQEAFVLGAREALRDWSGLAQSTPPVATLPSGPGDPLGGRHVPRRVEKVGRNEPCPCGSGKKYKKCHGG
jgi:tetratricopeptide (TPR) repeat protein